MSSCKENIDYKIMMDMINNVLNTVGPNGSIGVGKCYASKYKNMIDEMLMENEINNQIYQSLLSSVDTDLDTIRADSKRRIRSQFTDNNNQMMAMITDFVKSL